MYHVSHSPNRPVRQTEAYFERQRAYLADQRNQLAHQRAELSRQRAELSYQRAAFARQRQQPLTRTERMARKREIERSMATCVHGLFCVAAIIAYYLMFLAN